MGESLHLSLDSSLEGLTVAVTQLDQFAARHELTEELCSQLQLVLEELVTNIINHGYAGQPGNRIDLEIALAADEVVLRVEDFAPAFNPLLLPAPKLDLPLEQRKPGGLGIHLVKQMMDRIAYERVGNKNCLTVGKKITKGKP
jgi:serine/threonine-protein kinase RsbW